MAADHEAHRDLVVAVQVGVLVADEGQGQHRPARHRLGHLEPRRVHQALGRRPWDEVLGRPVGGVADVDGEGDGPPLEDERLSDLVGGGSSER